MVDDGLVIDLSAMKEIHVDPHARTATAQTGLTWGEFDRETQLHGLATTGGLISTTGIGGLTLGGGVGWLMGRCGLVCDNTLELRRRDRRRGSDSRHCGRKPGSLLGAERWRRKFRRRDVDYVPPVPDHHRPFRDGLHPLSNAREVLRFYRDFVQAGLPDELIVYAASISTPDGMPVIALLPAYCGDDLAEGERLLQPLRAFGSPIADLVQPMPYVAMQSMLDPAAPFGLRSYWKGTFLRELPDAAIDTFVDFAERCTSPRTFAILEHAHGAVERVVPDATAFTNREYPFDLVLISLWQDEVEDARHIEWTRQFYGAMQPWSAGLAYVNGLDQDDLGRVPQAYGRNYARLCEVKTKYDPRNRFREESNIRPRSEAAARRRTARMAVATHRRGLRQCEHGCTLCSTH